MPKDVVRILSQSVCFVLEAGRHRIHDLAAKCILLKIGLKPVRFKKILVIRKIVVALIVRIAIKSIHQQAPPTVAAAKVDGSIHRFHFFLLQPCFTPVKKKKGSFPVFNALTKAHPSSRLIIALIGCLFVDKSSYTAYGLS